MTEDIQIFLPKTNPHPSSSPNHQNPFTGLYNHGNTCYLNSLLQTLYMTPQFKSSILQWKYNSSSQPSKPDCIPYQLKKLFSRLQLQLRPNEETIPLTRSFQWNHNEILEQNDIQELLHLLLDAINERFIYDIFQGSLASTIKCDVCNRTSIHNETFIDLSLPVKTASKHLCEDLQQSFMKLFSVEKLEKDNQYYCEQCKCKVNADKYYTMTTFPQVLICALNRFEYNFKFDCKKKINNKLAFPLVFNVKDYIPNKMNDINYELYSIIVHSGSARGGHYYAVIKCGDDKWFKFDDSHVSEVNMNDLIEVLYGSEQTDTSAYMFLYKNTSTSVNDSNNSSTNIEIDEDVLKDIQHDEELYKQKQEEEKERMSYINLTTFYDGRYGKIKIKKYETVQELKIRIYELYKLTINIDDCRIRVFNSKNNKILDILNNESLTLEEVNASVNKVYNIETRKPNCDFKEFNPNIILIKTIVWDNTFTKVKDVDINAKQIEIDKTLSYDQCVSYLQKELNIPLTSNTSLLIMKKQEYGVNNFSFIQYTSTTEHFLEENMKLYIEQSQTLNTNINESKFKHLYESEIALVKIIFNTPLDPSKHKRISVKSYSFNHSIEINPRKTISELRERLSEVINIPIDNFIMKKNSHNGIEIKKYNDTIDKYTSKSLTLYLQIGKPIQPTDLKIRVQYYKYDNTVFALYPYKINDLGEFVINKTWSVTQLLKYFEEKNVVQKDSDINSEEYKLYLRKENNFKPGNFYNESDIIEQTDIKENQIVILQYIKQRNVFKFVKDKESDNDKSDSNGNGNTAVQFGVRIYDHNKWNISDVYELVVNKTISVEVFVKECLSKILEMNGSDNNYEHMVGTKIYNKEMHYFMDEIEKMEFFPFIDFYTSLIENYPFMLNCDSCLLLIKDLSKEYREPTDKEKEYFFKKQNSHLHTSHIKKQQTTTHTSSTTKKPFKPLKKDAYKEKAMVITVKHKQQQNENEQQPSSSSSSNKDTLIHT